MSALEWSRREFLFRAAAGSLLLSGRHSASAAESIPITAKFRNPEPFEALRKYIRPGQDGFACEAKAASILRTLEEGARTLSMPLAPAFHGNSPEPSQWKDIGSGIRTGVYVDSTTPFAAGWKQWLQSLGDIRRLQFFPLDKDEVRVEAESRSSAGLSYRVALWSMQWENDKLLGFRPISEVRSAAPTARFSDVSPALFGPKGAWAEQLTRGVPYWRSRLDSATGIDIYGSNGISAADIDDDGWDEIYVCQPGGLPNRLFKRGPSGEYTDIAASVGLDLLDDTSCAFFLDWRNSGLQDVVVLRSSGPLFFLNDGKGRYQLHENAFRFAQPVQGTFTGMSAEDYDRDGRVDLYLCTYVYFQSEDRYRYPVPYHDAENGPPNFLFRNRFEQDGSGFFEDVTAASGLGENNNRYSFTAGWCDYDDSGWPSLYVVNDFGRNNLYRNRSGKFTDVAHQAGVEDMGPGMGLSWFDENGDGRPDLYVSNMWSPAGQRVTADPNFALTAKAGLKDPFFRHTKGNSLFRNDGQGGFREVPDAGGAAVGRWAWSAEGVDFDNDGVAEIFGTAGMLTNTRSDDLMSFFWRQVVAKSPPVMSVAPEYEGGWNAINQFIREDYSWNGREPNVFFVRRDGKYWDVSGLSGLDFADDSRTFALTDFDRDGNVDIFLKSRLGPQVRAMQNRSTEGRASICFKLRGTRSNRDAIGGIVIVAQANGLRQRKMVSAGSGYLSQHTKKLYFGLDRSVVAERVEIRWPSGATQVLTNLDTGFEYELVEGQDTPIRKPFAKSAPLPSGASPSNNHVGLEPTWLVQPVPLPRRFEGPAFVLLTDGSHTAPTGVKTHVVDLKQPGNDTAAVWTLFRRYLFDWRTSLTAPFLILIDEQSRAHKVYPGIPDTAKMRRDLSDMEHSDQRALGLPFPGRYVSEPARNYYKLGAAFVGAGYPDEALPYLNAALEIWPENFKAWLAVGQVHLQQNRATDARKALERARELNPRSPELWNNLGGVALMEGRNTDAVECFQQMLQLAPESNYGLVNAGLAFAKLGRAADAERLYRKALKQNPSDPEVLDRLGLLVGQSGRLDEAIALFKEALSADSKYVSAVNNLGVAYMQLGKTDDALAAFRYGTSIAPEDDMVALNLARLYVASGRREQARQVLREFLANSQGSAAAARALRQLEEP